VTPREDPLMDYLLQHMIFYVACAFLLGVFVGWSTCSRREDR
jgi:hypothetical protein